MVQMETRNLRKVRQGVVVSNSMDKTIVIASKFKEKHPIYGKFVQKTKNTMYTMKRMRLM
ncbi:30S ribosomal protein S17 [Hoylesella buccalis ATCC 35310]|uniref:30S ribosomal protein S17 n=1 Tax=Hoylesella buccalis ATCC 35310 TaxID=679190 RepID=D1W7G4_9BACT|nr:30S ribosomal protein S17 [Hoylesella buccalis ATCC 35310]